MPKISIITPAWNTRSWISQAIESVLAQSFTDFEFLIVDDGSDDDTLKIAQYFASLDSRIKVFSQPHQGASAARNLGLKEATAELISFIDSDDIWEKDFLKLMFEEIEKLDSNYAGVFCRIQLCHEDGSVIASRFTKQRPGRYDFYDLFTAICSPGCGSCLLLKAACFREVGGFADLIAAEDAEMWIRISGLSSFKYFHHFPEQLLRYRQREGSLSATTKPLRLASLDKILRAWLPNIKPQDRIKICWGYLWFALDSYAYNKLSESYARKWSRLALGTGSLNSVFNKHGLIMLFICLVGYKNMLRLKRPIAFFLGNQFREHRKLPQETEA